MAGLRPAALLRSAGSSLVCGGRSRPRTGFAGCAPSPASRVT
jgi:hypothetical protein